MGRNIRAVELGVDLIKGVHVPLDNRVITVHYIQASSFFVSVPRVSRLLKCGVSPNASDGAESDNKVLHWVASYGTEEMVKLLCGKETDIQLVHLICGK